MPRFLIECRHSDDREGCIRALDAIAKYGSHLMTHADFGCADGDHAGWLIAELDDRDAALQMIPPQFREGSRVVKLRTWTREQIEEMARELDG